LNPHHPTRQQPKGQTGFSFIETLIVLAVLSVVVVQQLRTSELTSVDRVATGMVEKFQRVQRASLRYYSMNDNSWPANVQTLEREGFLNTEEVSNSWGKPFKLKVEGPESQDLSISSDLTEVRYASRVAGRLPRASLSVPDAAEASGVSGVGEVSNAGTVANALTTKVTSRIDPPGHEAAHDKLYRLDGTKELTGNMDAGGHNIENIGVLELAYDVDLGAECDQKYIGTTDTGMLVSCVNASENTEKKGKWRIPHELPVGAIHIAVTTDNPSESLGYGKWESFGDGRVMVGQEEKDKDYSSQSDWACIPPTDPPSTPPAVPEFMGTVLESVGGYVNDCEPLSLIQMPAHHHFNWYIIENPDSCVFAPLCLFLSEQPSSRTKTNQDGGSTNDRYLTKAGLQRVQRADTTKPIQQEGSKGLSESHEHNIVQPSIVVKMWKRIE